MRDARAKWLWLAALILPVLMSLVGCNHRNHDDNRRYHRDDRYGWYEDDRYNRRGRDYDRRRYDDDRRDHRRDDDRRRHDRHDDDDDD